MEHGRPLSFSAEEALAKELGIQTSEKGMSTKDIVKPEVPQVTTRIIDGKKYTSLDTARVALFNYFTAQAEKDRDRVARGQK